MDEGRTGRITPATYKAYTDDLPDHLQSDDLDKAWDRVASELEEGGSNPDALIFFRLSTAMRQGGAGITGPTVISPAASAASISEALFAIYSRGVNSGWLPSAPQTLRELPSLKHYQHSVGVLSAMYMTPEELVAQNPFSAYEKGIHDIFSGEPWDKSVCDVQHHLPELLTDEA